MLVKQFIGEPVSGQWTFLSNHTHVLICIANDPTVRVRDIAEMVEITERAVLRIISELEEGGFVEHERVGRRNSYTLNLDAKLRHPLEEGTSLRQLLKGVVSARSLQHAGGKDSGGKGRA